MHHFGAIFPIKAQGPSPRTARAQCVAAPMRMRKYQGVAPTGMRSAGFFLCTSHFSTANTQTSRVASLSLNLAISTLQAGHLAPIYFTFRQNKMEAVKKKLATLKEEKELAVEKYEEAEKARKEAEDRAEQVR